MRKKRIYDSVKRRERYLDNRERDIEQAKRYQREHKEKTSQKNKAYYQKNKEKLKKRTVENRRKKRLLESGSNWYKPLEI